MSATCTHEHSGNQTWRQLAPIENMGAICTHAPMSDEKQYPSQLADRFQVRMPEGLRDRIRASAEANNRSMNAEILARLEGSYESEQYQMDKLWADIQELIKSTVERSIREAIKRALSEKK